MGVTAFQWNQASITRLFRVLVLSRGSFTLAAALLPDLSTAVIRKAVRQISLAHRNPPSWSDSKHTIFVLNRVASHSLPPAARSQPMPSSSNVSKRIVLQLVPASARDSQLVRAGKHHPFLELVLRAKRPLWDVYAHVYTKWELPIRLLSVNHFSIHTSVACILPPNSALVRLQYQVISVPIDFSALSCVIPSNLQIPSSIQQQPGNEIDDQFWTENTASLLPLLDIASDSLFNTSSNLAEAHPLPVEPCLPPMKKRRVVAPLSLHAPHHPQKQKPSRPQSHAAPPHNKSIIPLPPARVIRKKTQNKGEKAVLNRLRSHLEQLSSKPSQSTGTPSACLPLPASTIDADSNNINSQFLAASDSMLTLGMSTPFRQTATSNYANAVEQSTAAEVHSVHDAMHLNVHDELAVDLTTGAQLDAQHSTALGVEPPVLQLAPSTSLNFSALFQDL